MYEPDLSNKGALMADKSKKPAPVEFKLRDAIAGIASSVPESIQLPAPSFPNAWHIVVVGNIDPRQHHPMWYGLIGCLSESEIKEAMPTIDAGMNYWAFNCHAYRIIAQYNKWEISTTAKDNVPRIKEVACRVFSRLFEITIAAIGVNAQFHIETKAPDVREILRNKVLGTNLGFSGHKDADSQIVYRWNDGTYTTAWLVCPSLSGLNTIYIAQDKQYKIQKTDAGPDGFFKFEEILHRFAEKAWQEAELFGEAVSEKLDHFVGGF